MKLRALEPEDVELMLQIENEPADLQHTDIIAPYSRRQLLEYALNYDADPFRCGQLRMVLENDEGEGVGLLDLYDISQKNLNAFVGISILPEYRNRGYGFISLHLLTRYALNTLGLRQLGAKILVSNKSARSLFESVGFRLRGTLKSWQRVDQQFQDVALYQFVELPDLPF